MRKTMKVILLTLAFYCLSETAFSQNMTLEMNNVTVKEAIQTLKEKTGYSFIYEVTDLDSQRKISVKTINKSIDEVVKQILIGQKVTYTISGKIIVVTKAQKSTSDTNILIEPISKKINGLVTDEKSDPIIGASVILKGSKIGTVTDEGGKYTIEAPINGQLQFSYIGYTSKSVNIDDKTVINLTLIEDTRNLDEVVVVGYGVQKRSDITGAVTSINSKQFERMPQVTIGQALQGKVAGLNVSVSSSDAEDSGTSMLIRGKNSISASSNPLIVLDGIPYEKPISEINPNDIESIEVLKDASSAAIYGSRASNGVILITSKKGVKGKAHLKFDSFYGIDLITKEPKFFSPDAYYKAVTERVGYNYPLTATEKENYAAGKATDWYGLATRMGERQQHNISISGGTEDVKYYLSGGLSNTKGTTINDDFTRGNLRVNLEGKINSWLTLGSNSQLGYINRNGIPVRYQFQGISNAPSPFTQAYNVDGTLKLFPEPTDGTKWEYGNVLDALLYQNEDITRSVVTNNYLLVTFPFIKGLQYKLNTGYTYRNNSTETYFPITSARGTADHGASAVSNQHYQDWLVDNIITYQFKLAKHNFTFTGLYSAQQTQDKRHQIDGKNYPNDFQTVYQTSNAVTITGSDNYLLKAYISQMGRLNYNYNNKYLLTATVRRDGYSGFGSNSKFGLFPSVALGWNVQEESFAKSLTFLDRAKVRVSYGKNGNQAISPYQTMPSLSTIWYLNDKEESAVGYYPQNIGDPSLGWETTNSFNVGLDFSVLKGRISGTIDVFKSKTDNLLLDRIISPINGTTKIKQNVGSTSNQGYEIQFSSINISKKDFTWTTDLILSYSHNKILNVGVLNADGSPGDDVGNRWFIGNQINVDYGYVFDHILQVGETAPISQPNALQGYVLAKDVNGDNKITTADMSIRGSSVPLYFTSLNNTFTYKNFTLNLFLNAQFGKIAGGDNNSWNRGNTIYKEFWTPETPNVVFPTNDDKANPWGISVFDKRNNCDFIRLQDVTLSYKLPKNVLNILSASQCEVYCNAKNLYTLTNWTWGPDPEFSNQRGTPFITTVLWGLRLTF